MNEQKMNEQKTYNEQQVSRFIEIADQINKIRGDIDSFVAGYAGIGSLREKLLSAEDAAKFTAAEIDRINKNTRPEHYYAD